MGYMESSASQIYDAHTRLFEENRSVLTAIAYRMLGSVADAEDVVHDTYLRWRQADLQAVRSPREYLLSITTRLAIDSLRSARTRRETYFGEWLPEPTREDAEFNSGGERALELSESLQSAFLLLLERLTPTQRAAYLLHEVFGFKHAEAARMLGLSDSNCRQLVSRARAQLRDGRAGYDPSPDRIAGMTRRFLEVCEGEASIDAFVELLAEDAVFIGDGGGKVRSVPRPIYGADRVARLLVGILKKFSAGITMRMENVSGQPSVVMYLNDTVQAVLTLAVAGGRIRRIHVVLNPDKLLALVTTPLRPPDQLLT